MKTPLLLGAVVVVVLVLFAGSPFYTLDHTQQAVITQFGKAVGKPVTTPGLKLKMPFIHKVNYFPRQLIAWDGDPGQIVTKDKTYIGVDAFGRWRITDALAYFRKVNNEPRAHALLDGIINSAVRNLVTSNFLIEVVRNSNRDLEGFSEDSTDTQIVLPQKLELGRARMCEEILAQARPKLAEFGIELVDVRFKRINYVDEVLRKVYDRMIAERRQVAEKYRAEGRGESAKIKGEKERDLKQIQSEAYRRAQILKGEADARATAIYAAAYSRDPEFYSFIRTLDLYRASIDSTTWAVLSTKNDILRYFTGYSSR